MRRVATLHIDCDNSEYSSDAKDVQGGGLTAPPELKSMSEETYLDGCRLLLATTKNDIARVRELLQQGTSINFRDYDRCACRASTPAKGCRRLGASAGRLARLPHASQPPGGRALLGRPYRPATVHRAPPSTYTARWRFRALRPPRPVWCRGSALTQPPPALLQA